MTTAVEGVRVARILPFLALVVLQVYTLVDLVRSDEDAVRSLPKAVWFLVWVVPVLGPVAWLVLGRPRVGPSSGGGNGGGGGITGGPRPSRGPVAPDDDPEFLKRLDEQSWSARMERLRRERQSGGDSTNGSRAPETPPAPDEAPGESATSG